MELRRPSSPPRCAMLGRLPLPRPSRRLGSAAQQVSLLLMVTIHGQLHMEELPSPPLRLQLRPGVQRSPPSSVTAAASGAGHRFTRERRRHARLRRQLQVLRRVWSQRRAAPWALGRTSQCPQPLAQRHGHRLQQRREAALPSSSATTVPFRETLQRRCADCRRPLTRARVEGPT